MQVSNRQRKADEEYVKGFFLLSRDLREDILRGRFRVRKTDIKKLGKIEGIRDGSIESIEQIQSMINATPKSSSERKFHPMLFSTQMVRALLDGRKTQTRRVPTPNSPKVKTGDIIWVRETFSQKNDRIIYLSQVHSKWDIPDGYKWTPSLFMPKSICRLFLEITDVQMEYLNEISEEDAIAEGVQIMEWNDAPNRYKDYLLEGTMVGKSSPIESYKSLWLSLNGENSWEKNLLVWVYSFKIIERPENWPKRIKSDNHN